MVATALVALQAIVQPTRAVVRSASPAIFGSPGRDGSMASRDYRSLPATMPGDVPLDGPRRAGPSSVFGIACDRCPPAPSRRPGRPGGLAGAARRPVRAGGAGSVSSAGQSRLAAFAHGAGGRYLRTLGLSKSLRL